MYSNGIFNSKKNEPSQEERINVSKNDETKDIFDFDVNDPDYKESSAVLGSGKSSE